MELLATIDGSSHLFFLFYLLRDLLFFFSTFYINHNLPFMNDGKGLVPLRLPTEMLLLETLVTNTKSSSKP